MFHASKRRFSSRWKALTSAPFIGCCFDSVNVRAGPFGVVGTGAGLPSGSSSSRRSRTSERRSSASASCCSIRAPSSANVTAAWPLVGAASLGAVSARWMRVCSSSIAALSATSPAFTGARSAGATTRSRWAVCPARRSSRWPRAISVSRMWSSRSSSRTSSPISAPDVSGTGRLSGAGLVCGFGLCATGVGFGVGVGLAWPPSFLRRTALSSASELSGPKRPSGVSACSVWNCLSAFTVALSNFWRLPSR